MSLVERGLAAAGPRPVGAALRSLRPGEAMLLSVMAGTGLLLVALSALRSQAVDWAALSLNLVPGTFLIALGLYARGRGRMPPLATFVIAAGFYSNFGNLAALVIYTRFPLDTGTIDPLLTALDARLGYDWPSWVAAMAGRPILGAALALVYQSALWQLLGLMATLALLRRDLALDRFMLAGALALLLTAAIWWAAPSLGPAAMHAIPAELEAAASLVVDAAYGAELRRLAAEGNAVISPNGIVGAIAFPSYHMVMACLAVWFARGTPLLWPALLLNLPMIPATMVQGGHHATDLIGGAAVFALATWAAARLLPAAPPPAAQSPRLAL